MGQKKLVVAALVGLAAVVALMIFWPLGGGESTFTFCFGGTINEQLGQVKSPDGSSVAILSHRYKHGPGRPPEPPKTLERWARLKIARRGRTVYDSGYENLNVYQMSAGFALDVAWSPDSKYLAYRHIASLRIIGPDGKASLYDVAPDRYVVSSFRWIDNNQLLVVSKKTRYPLEMHGKPFMYNGYTDDAEAIHIARVNLLQGKADRYEQALKDATGGGKGYEQTAKRLHLADKPTFLFHAIGFCLDEISPNADRVAFSDGDSLCIYDDTPGRVVAHLKIPQKPLPELPPPPPLGEATGEQLHEHTMLTMAARPSQLEGIWWETNDRVLLGIGLLGSPPDRYAFYTYDIPTQVLTDQSSVLMPLWMGNDKTRNYQDPDWFRSAIK